MNRLMKKLKRWRSGMTMVEVVVSVALIAVAALILSSAFGASLNVARRGVDSQSAGNSAFTAIEQQSAASGSTGSIAFSAGGKDYTVSGRYLSQTQTVNGVQVTFHSFEATGP